MMQTTNDEILTVEEAAGLLKVAPDVVLNLLVSNDLPGRNIAGQWRTTTRALVSYVDGVPLQMSCCTPEMCCKPAANGSQAATGRGCCC